MCPHRSGGISEMSLADRLAALLMKPAADREKQNIVWNMIGSFCYAFASMVLSFLVMRIAGDDDGGIFAFGYSTFGQQMFLVAYFGLRPFQITDGKGEYRFGDYLLHRCLTCALAVAAGAGYLLLGGYTVRKALIIFLLVCYKVIDGFADVYESEFQRQGHLHLTGKSNAFRTILSVTVFHTALLAGRQLVFACGAAVAAQAAGVWLFDVSVIRRLPSVDTGRDWSRLRPLTGAAALLFVSVFLDFYIFSAAKYAIDANMDNAASGYFNIIFMPTSVINLAAGFVIRPVLTYLTDAWTGRDFAAFRRLLRRISALIAVLGIAAAALAWFAGRPVLGIMERLLGDGYAGSLVRYHVPFVMVVLGGGFYAILNLYYYVLVILRRQDVIFGIYVVMTAAAAVAAPAMVRRGGIGGAAFAYLMLMAVMAAGFTGGALNRVRAGERADSRGIMKNEWHGDGDRDL